jgi:hypothetical protein
MFAVAIEQPDARNSAKFKYQTADLAERKARAIVRSGLKPEISIWRQPDTLTPTLGQLSKVRYPEHVATVLTDALDRVWTQVSSGPSQRAFL